MLPPWVDVRHCRHRLDCDKEAYKLKAAVLDVNPEGHSNQSRSSPAVSRWANRQHARTKPASGPGMTTFAVLLRTAMGESQSTLKTTRAEMPPNGLATPEGASAWLSALQAHLGFPV